MFTHLLPLFSHLPASAAAIPWTSSRTKTLSSLSHFERELQASQPTLKYDHLLEEAYLLFAESLGVKLTLEVEREARSFGGSIASWTAFEVCYSVLPDGRGGGGVGLGSSDRPESPALSALC